MSKGIIYICTTSISNLIKIGSCQFNEFESRMIFLECNGYCNVHGLKRKFAIEVDDYNENLAIIEDKFSNYRLKNTELFSIDSNEIINYLSSIGGKQIYSDIEFNNKLLNEEKISQPRLFYEPINLNTWEMFEVIKGIGHKEGFLATKSMKKGDYLILYVGTQNKDYESGVYAVAKIIKDPELYYDENAYHCNGRLAVFTEIIKFSKDCLISKEEFAKYVNNYRSAKIINPIYYDELKMKLDL